MSPLCPETEQGLQCNTANIAGGIYRTALLDENERFPGSDQRPPTNFVHNSDARPNSRIGRHTGRKISPSGISDSTSYLHLRQRIASRPGVNGATPLARIISPSAPLSSVPPPTTTIITDALYVLCLYRTLLIFASHGRTSLGLLHFILVFLPLHTTYILLICEHDRYFARDDMLHTIYTGARISILFGAAFTAPGVFNIVNGTWRGFCVFIIAGRAAHTITHIIAAIYEKPCATRSWWLVSVRAATVLAPCILWAVSLGLGDQDRRIWDIVSGLAVILDQACLIALGIAEARMETGAVNTHHLSIDDEVMFETASHRSRIGLCTSLLIAAGVIGIFETRPYIDVPASLTAISLYPRSLISAIVGLCILYAMERLYFLCSSHRGIWLDSTAINRSGIIPRHSRDAQSEAMKRDISPIRSFFWEYLHIPLHVSLMIAIYGLHGMLKLVYEYIREQPTFSYDPPPNPPFVSGAQAAQNLSSSAQDLSNKFAANQSMPYAVSLFSVNPVTGGSSRLVNVSSWTEVQLFSIGLGVVMLCLALIGLLDVGKSSKRHWSSFVVRIGIGALVSIPAFLEAGAVASLGSIGSLLVLAAVIGDALNS
ncbi:uncharacterized protein SPPG_03859 [Spizellomyces punctatus DAOM BR117]|uniref:Uncharacterized protein n=1 Tax=Spizellomyces punctatus (strain DAOM BR117) TaxID=645134 RepID=A0A0L0HI19_SPIPD|nr:uncharacterized protein SPPG_03859 [Spizellomyces punctatus DAOM BR117]KND00743.1 hypothetical protein SPPG_03859 [Spizellomyces punctatus DAOM BR117]|eukprot:XP_016608782.1 hypothetical protein SPPG_03859 [Spizellomyces punctatus DAOM BR117]